MKPIRVRREVAQDKSYSHYKAEKNVDKESLARFKAQPAYATRKNCIYPDCVHCTEQDCNMESNDIAAMLKRRRYQANPELHREKQALYRAKIKSNLPRCEECTDCVYVKKVKQDGFCRLCIREMQLIEQKVSNSPQWCHKRRQKGEHVKNNS